MDKQLSIKGRLKGYKRGKCQMAGKCCREIRIQAPHKAGTLYSGFNTLTEEQELWLCLKEKWDFNNSIMQKLTPVRK